MILKFTVEGEPIPLGRPRRGTAGNFYTPKRSLTFQSLVAWQARAQKTSFGSRDVSVSTVFFCKSNRKSDGDNLHKNVLDSLERAGVFDNDSQVVKGYYEVYRGVKHPRTEVVVYPVAIDNLSV